MVKFTKVKFEYGHGAPGQGAQTEARPMTAAIFTRSDGATVRIGLSEDLKRLEVSSDTPFFIWPLGQKDLEIGMAGEQL